MWIILLPYSILRIISSAFLLKNGIVFLPLLLDESLYHSVSNRTVSRIRHVCFEAYNSPINHKFLTLSKIVFLILPDKNDQTCLTLVNFKWPQNIFFQFFTCGISKPFFCSFWLKQHKHFRFAMIFERVSTLRLSICYCFCQVKEKGDEIDDFKGTKCYYPPSQKQSTKYRDK